jgi:hypothetical protein
VAWHSRCSQVCVAGSKSARPFDPNGLGCTYCGTWIKADTGCHSFRLLLTVGCVGFGLSVPWRCTRQASWSRWGK